MASLEIISQYLTMMSENFKAAPSENMSKLLIAEMQKFTDAQVAEGLTRILRTRKYSGFPTLAEILEAVQGSQQDALALEALEQFDKARRMQHDVYDSPRPELLARMNPVGRHVFRIMGDCSKYWTDKHIDFKRKDFVEMYVRLARNPEKLKELGYQGAGRHIGLLGCDTGGEYAA